VIDIENDKAKFEYCGGVVNTDFFEDICTFENNPAEVPNKTKIITTVPGIVRRDNNNVWNIEERAKIKFL